MDLSFDCTGLEPRVIRGITYTNQANLTTEYCLQEASAGAVSTWRDAQFSHHRMEDGKLVADNLKGMSETSLLLVSLCLWEMLAPDKDGNQKTRAVPIQVVRGFTDRFQRRLYDKALEISELEEEHPARKALLEAFSGSHGGPIGAPCDLPAFRTWVESLVKEDKKTYDPLWLLVRPAEGKEADREARLKNGHTGTLSPSAKP